MSTALNLRPAAPRRAIAPPRLLYATWTAVFVNVIALSSATLLVPFPRSAAQMLTQGSVLAAVILGLVANRRGIIRPSFFLVLLSVLAVATVMVSVHNEFLVSSTFRACRFVAFVAALWLLTRWFGRRDMALLRCHLWVLRLVLGSVVLGALISPGLAFSFQGRLSGILWPIAPTQVAHYAGVTVGATAVLWMCRVVPGRTAAVVVPVGVAMLLATHTRTALLASLVGIVVATATLFLTHARARRAMLAGSLLAVLAAVVFAPQITEWALRGQSDQDVTQLTGRTKVWSQVMSMERPPLEHVFGSGLSNMSFNGLPIDSSWVSTYYDEGWFGMVLIATMLLALLLVAAAHEHGPQRAVAVFLVFYCVVASFTESGLNAPSPYLLDLFVAASLLAPPVSRRIPPPHRSEPCAS